MSWHKDQVKAFVKTAKDRAGNGWYLLGHDLQEALVCRELIYVLSGQQLATIKTEDVQTLLADALKAAGLESE